MANEASKALQMIDEVVGTSNHFRRWNTMAARGTFGPKFSAKGKNFVSVANDCRHLLEEVFSAVDIAIASIAFLQEIHVTFRAIQTQRMKMVVIHFENELIADWQ